MIRILSHLDLSRYSPRLFIVSAGDAHSARLVRGVHQLNDTSAPGYKIVQIPRARRVKQSLLTTPLSALYSLIFCFSLFLTREMAQVDVVLMNGPGTCVPLCLAAFAQRLVGLHSPRMIYIESLARVKRLSLTAKLVQYLVDSMLVQWPLLANDGKWWRCKREYVGWLQ